jgi:hypothetical protein
MKQWVSILTNLKNILYGAYWRDDLIFTPFGHAIGLFIEDRDD